MFWHGFVVNDNSGKGIRTSAVGSYFFWPLGHKFLCMGSYNKDLMLLFNQYIVASLFWWFYPHLRQGNTPVGHWFVRCSFFPVWGRCNFLILLLNTDLKAVLPQPSQVVTACLAPHIASESSYLSWLYFRICTLSPSSARETGSRLAS